MSPSTEATTSRISAPAKFSVTSPGLPLADAIPEARPPMSGAGDSRRRTTISGPGSGIALFVDIVATARPRSEPAVIEDRSGKVAGCTGSASDDSRLLQPEAPSQAESRTSAAAASQRNPTRFGYARL